MDPSLFTALIAGILGLIVGLLSPRIKRMMKTENKILVSTDEDGKEESIFVPSGATRTDIQQQLRRTINLERRIADILKDLAANEVKMDIHTSKNVDFIATDGNRKIALEVKLDPRSINIAQLHKYLSAEPGIEELIIASPMLPSQKLRNTIAHSKQFDRVRFLTMSNDASELRDQIKREVSSALVKARA